MMMVLGEEMEFLVRHEGASVPLSAQVSDLYHKLLLEPENSSLVAELALCLADSGAQRARDATSVDVASSGGPSSLSTLLCPLYLVGMGLRVPKVGVPGRPAGGVDVLGAIPGYRTQLTASEFDEVVAGVGYAHVAAGDIWAPADAALFRIRQVQGTQARPSLAAASLLAKKLAAGVQVAALDARVAEHGNFGTNLADARQAAEIYCAAGLQLGLQPVVFLTDAAVPFQPFLGRGEALTAVAMVVSDTVGDSWLKDHADMCLAMSRIAESYAAPRDSKNVSNGLDRGIASIACANLSAQGSSQVNLEKHLDNLSLQKRTYVEAGEGGFVHYDLGSMRNMLVALTSSEPGVHADSSAGEYSDVVGIRMLCHPEREIRKGEPVLELRGFSAAVDISRSFSIQRISAGKPNVIREVVAP